MFSTKPLRVALAAGLAIAAGTAGAQQLKEVLTGVRPGEISASTIRKAPEDASYKTNLIGFVYYAESWNYLSGDESTPMGIYTIDVTPGSQPQRFAQIGKMNSHCNGGAVLAGDTFWYIWRQTDPTGSTGIDISQLYSYNILNGTAKSHGVVSSELASSADKAWDPITKQVYGQYKSGDDYQLCIVDFDEQTVTPVGKINFCYAIAFDATGQLYGIDTSGNLNKIDKETGASTLVGNTGVIPAYSQSMTIDFKTGDIWWASYTNSEAEPSVLYKVDRATGKATKVTVFTDKEEIMGLGTMPAIAPDGAPGYASNLALDTDKASTRAVLRFDMPRFTYMGEPLSGKIKWKALANDKELTSGENNQGESVSTEVNLPTGEVTVAIICSNAEGDGPAASVTKWIGEGYPLMPQNVKLYIEEKSGKVQLTWDAVTEAEKDGYLDPEKVTYKVIAMPGNREVAKDITGTSFTETLTEPEQPQAFFYKVIACNGWRESEPAESNHVPYGKGFPMPYDNSFPDASSLDFFYIIDGNNDETTWKWSKFGSATAYIFTGSNVAGEQDDWLITPGLDMKGGSRYQLTYFTTGNIGTPAFEDYLEVGFGLGIDPASYKIVEERYVYDKNDKYARHDVIVEPQEDGYYHIGFHAVSNCKKGMAMNIDDLHIDILADPDAPAAPTELSAKTSKGTAPITVSFKAPEKTVKGDKLEKITKVELWRNLTDLVATDTDVTPGKKMSLVDNKGAKGDATYSVVAYNDKGVGERAEIGLFIGLDLPGAPQQITLKDMGKAKLKLTWDAPEIGARGGYINPQDLTYNVYTIINGYAGGYQEKAITEKEVNISDVSGYYDKQQELVLYGVSAINTIGEGNIYQSSEVIVGQPYAYPFTESWAKGVPQQDMWYRRSNGQNGWLPTAEYDSDSDGGCMEFSPAADGDMSYLCLGKIDLTGAQTPKLIFDYYAKPGTDAFIIPEINKAFIDGWQPIAPLQFSELDGMEGWREYVFDLSSFTEYPYISVRFLAGGKADTPILIDNVRVMDSDKVGAIEAIEGTTDSPALYWQINGMKISSPTKGGIYIRKNPDGTVTKTRF